VFWLIAVCPFGTDECVLNFDQRIEVRRNASLRVREDITVKSAGAQIKRGIYREFPTIYRWKGKRFRVKFRILKVLRDGKPENWFIKKLQNGVRVYIGRKDRFLEPGTHTYRIVYETDRQIGFFKDHDELYWNVNGTGWELPMGEVVATVVLPGNIPADSLKYEAYTGFYGERGRDYRVEVKDSEVRFSTTRPLRAGENLTIVVGWPKGYVKEPSLLQRMIWFLTDNISILLLWLLTLGVLVYYLIAWARVGRDPPKGTIIPLFHPPKGMSPAAVRYVLKMGYDDTCLTANLISLAVKGYLRIVQEDEDTYYLIGKEGNEKLTKDEAVLLAMRDHRIKRGEYSLFLKHVRNNLQLSLIKLWGHLFRLNRNYVALGWIFSVVGVVLALTPVGIDNVMAMLFEDFPFSLLYLVLPLVILVILNVFFGHYMKAPTKEGRRIQDEIEGFRMFLTTAEKDRLQALFPKDSVPTIYERFLPYALALDVADTWASKFAKDLKAVGYEPAWYEGPYRGYLHRGMYSRFVGSLSRSISESVASASRPPGTSSGFSSSGGGGGYSGGGGGGGGGGGW